MALPTSRGREVVVRRGRISPLAKIASGISGIVPFPITAAARRSSRETEAYYRRLIQPWQARALSYYELVGECWNASQFYSRSLKQIRLFAAERDDQGELKPTENQEAQDFVARIQDPGGGGYSQLMDSYGRLRFLIGEGYFLVTNPTGTAEQWEFVSPDELRLADNGAYMRMLAPSLPAEQLVDVPDSAYQPVGNEALVFRSWRPSPRYSALADSPIRAVLDILEELVLLTLAVRSTAKSRTVRNGILLVPDELSPTNVGVAGGDEDPAGDILIQDLIEQAIAPIANPGSAAAVFPAVLRGGMEYLAAVKWLQISNPMETYPEEGLRTEAIRRFATGIEMPTEVLTGTADVNHWGSWLIDGQAARQYIFPACQDFCDDVTAVAMRPTLRDAGVPDWDRYLIAYDASAVVASADRSADAKDLHDRFAISDEALREAADFNDSDAPDQDELDRRIATKMNNAAALSYVDESSTTPEVAPDEVAIGEEGGPDGNNEVDPGIPATKPANGEAFSTRQRDAVEACLLALSRGRGLAGARLRSLTRDGATFDLALHTADQVEQASNEMLAATLGAQWVRQHTSKNDLQLASGTALKTVERLGEIGVNGEIAARLGEMVQDHCARTLYKPFSRELPRGIVAFIAQRVQ